MKKIVVSCGSGVVTSAIVARMVADMLDERGYAGRYTIERCCMADAPARCTEADFLIATTIAPLGITCEYVSGVPFLTGKGKADAERRILSLMEQAPQPDTPVVGALREGRTTDDADR